MNYISYFLAQHHIKKVLYFTNKEQNPCYYKDCLNMSSFEDIVLVTPEQKLNSYKEYAFVFDHVTDTEYIKHIIETYKPNVIIGHFPKGFSTFDVWEFAKDYVKEMHLGRTIDEHRNEALEWKPNPKTNIELSIIFPTYNVEPYLEKCLQTVTKCKAPYVEFIFVDDGSTDKSADVIKEWAKNDKRIKLLQKENGGCASAREYGIAHSSGKYIGLVDPDDFVDENMFRKLLTSAFVGMYDISYCGYNEYYEADNSFKAIDDVLSEPYTDGVVIEDLISKLIAIRRIAIWRGLYKREMLENNNIHFHEDIKRFDDLPFKVETLARAKSVVALNEYLYYYRMNRPGQDVSAHDERLFVHFDIFKHLDEFFEKRHTSNQLKYYYQVKIQTHYWALSHIEERLINEYLEKASKDLGINNTSKDWKNTFKKCYKNKDVKLIMKRIKHK